MTWDEAIRVAIKTKGPVTYIAGGRERTSTYEAVLFAIGFQGAQELGVFDDYSRIILRHDIHP